MPVTLRQRGTRIWLICEKRFKTRCWWSRVFSSAEGVCDPEVNPVFEIGGNPTACPHTFEYSHTKSRLSSGLRRSRMTATGVCL
eukprot:3136041-Pyramimonas_sp.AAC.1